MPQKNQPQTGQELKIILTVSQAWALQFKILLLLKTKER